MKRFKNILVVAGGKDGGLAAVTRAADLGQRNGAKITIVDVVEPLPPLLNVPGIDAEETHQEMMARKQLGLQGLSTLLLAKGLDVQCKILTGSAAQQIVEHVITFGNDLLLKTAEEPAGIFRRLFGTTGLRLMRKCPCPVWIVKATAEKRFHRILAAVEPRPLDQRRDPLNLTILELATSLAKLENSELHVVYVWPHWTDWAVPESDGAESTKRVRHEVETLQRKMLTKLTARFEDVHGMDHVHLLKGNPAEEISKLANELDMELLVMGTVCRTGVAGFVIGNTAEHVLDQVNCSVLTVKPDGFKSPTEVRGDQAPAGKTSDSIQ